MKVILEGLRKILIYIIVGLAYYLLPLVLIKDTGSAMMTILLLLPSLIFIVSLISAKNSGLKLYKSIIIGLLWIPNIWVMNSSTIIYIFIYAGISIIGQAAGMLFRKTNNSETSKQEQ